MADLHDPGKTIPRVNNELRVLEGGSLETDPEMRIRVKVIYKEMFPEQDNRETDQERKETRKSIKQTHKASHFGSIL